MLVKSLILFFFTSFVCAQTLTVIDEKTFQPLELVSVYSGDLNRALVTDSRGKVDIGSLKSSGEIIIRLLGYKTVKKSYKDILAQNSIVYLKEIPVSLGNVIVTAKRWDEDISEIPHSISFINPKDIETFDPQTTADMLNQNGKVYVQKSQLGGGSPMIRGFATNRVLIVVDNVRMNTAIFRSGNLQNVISVDANTLSNAQVIFGPSSVIYGSDAIGGVMEFNTLSPLFSYSDQLLLNGDVFTRYSSANQEKTGHINIRLGSGNWGFLSSLTYSKFEDLKMGSNGPGDYLRTVYQDRINGVDTAIVNENPDIQKLSGYDQINFMQKIRFKPNEDWELNYGFHYSKSSDVPRYDRLIELSNGIPKYAQWYYGPQIWMMNRFSVSNFSSNKIYDLSKIIFAYQNFEESRHDRKFNKSTLRNRTETVNAFSINLDFVKNLNTNSKIFYGIETVYNKVGSTGESNHIISGETEPVSPRYPDGSIWNSYGAYLTYKNNLSEEYILQTGIRYNLVYLESSFDTTFFPFPFTKVGLTTGAFTGTAGLVWHPTLDWQVNLNFSTGFRAPNIDDVGKVFDSEPGAVVVPNPHLRAEYIYSGELGVMKVFGDDLKVDLIGFYSYLDKALVRRDYTLGGRDSIYYDGELSGVQAIQNAAHAYVWGVQAGIDYKFTKDFQFISTFSFQQGEEEDDGGDIVPLRHSAPWFGKTQLIFNKDRFNLRLYIDYNGEVSFENLAPSERGKTAIYALDEKGNPYSPAWYTLNFKASVRVFENFKINLGIENITDQRYRTYSSGISAPGRNYIATVRYSL